VIGSGKTGERPETVPERWLGTVIGLFKVSQEGKLKQFVTQM